ncbi:MAG TPA: hypothetical protein VL357_08985 [Rariglobus sp.]|jgi:hypothetical protein|nr:hypothetical protein [Rariglobus sp.]
MATYRYVEIDLKGEGGRLADLNGIREDLSSAQEYSKRYVANYLKEPDLYSILTFIVIKYVRCFNGGVRKRTSDELLHAMSADDRTVHDIIYALRDKHVGHSVSDWESHKIRLWLVPEERGPKKFSVSISSDSVLGPPAHFVEELIGVIERLQSQISTMEKVEQERLKLLIQSQYSMDEIYAMDASVPSPPSYASLLGGKGRKAP